MYDMNFYDTIRPGCIHSAEVVLEMIHTLDRRVETVLDLGCGEGWWGHTAKRIWGSRVTGIDSSGFHSPKRASLDEWSNVDILDVIQYRHGPYDLVICLEVAEHLPASHADRLVDFLAHAGKTVLFSAAIPMQGGLGHINEQWPSYWLEKFNHWNMFGDGSYRKELWDDPNVEPWYKQNLILFEEMPGLVSNYECQPLVHPAFWSTRTGAPLP